MDAQHTEDQADQGQRRRGGRNRRNERSTNGENEGEALNFSLPVPDVASGPFQLAPDASPQLETPVQQQPITFVAPPAAQATVELKASAPETAPDATAPAFATPELKRYELPLSDLDAIAQQAGLAWVNSNAEKIRAVQEAMAAEVKPVRIPRERPPQVVLDEGPLILVETRKDLDQVKLPFENAA
jgi:ribonuclease E